MDESARQPNQIDESEFARLAFCYLEGRIHPRELEQLQAGLSDPSRQDMFVDLCLTRRGVIEMARARAQRSADAPPAPDPQTMVISSRMSDTMILPAITSAELDEEEPPLAAPASWKMAAAPDPRARFKSRLLRAAVILPPLICLAGWWMFHGNTPSSLAVLKPQTNPPLIAPSVPAPAIPPSAAALTASMPAAPPPLATIRLSLDAKWDQSYNALPTSAPLEPRQHILDQGIVQLDLLGGAKVVVQAPAKFEVVSGSRIELVSGQISAVVPHGGSGLTIHGSDLQIVDLGTEFGVAVDPGKKTHVEVFAGRVSTEVLAEPAGASTTQIVESGHAVAVTVRNGLNQIEKDATEPLGFVRVQELTDRAADGGNVAFPRWKAFSETIRHDPSLLAYYTFERQPNAESKLANQSIATAGRNDGTLGIAGNPDSAPQWSQGRWPGKGALLFGDHSGTAVLIPGGSSLIPPSNLSVAFWVKRSEPSLPVHLINQADGPRGRFNISIIGTAGKKAPALLPNSIYFNFGPGTEISMPQLLPTDDQWLFIAVTVDADRNTCFYINGKLEMQSPIKRVDLTTAVGDLCIGRAAPGNTNASAKDIFRGCMDELAIFHRQLSALEVWRMYDAGRPR